MSKKITERTEAIVNKMDNLMAKLLGNSGVTTFTSMSDDEAIMLKDTMVLMKDLDGLLIDYAEALDKIDDLSTKLDALTELIKKMKDEKK